MIADSLKTRGRTLDHVAGLYDLIIPIVSLGRSSYYFRKTIKELNILDTDKILDVGCGTGHFSELMLKEVNFTGGSVTAIDAAVKMIEKAQSKKLGNSAIFDAVLAEDLPYNDNYFDKAASLFFFHHVDYELKVKSLNEIYRVLKNDSELIIIDIDKPTNFFGSFCILCGEYLFRQPEIKENRLGFLSKAFNESKFSKIEFLDSWFGYVSMYKLTKLG